MSRQIQEGALTNQGVSETAATVGKRLYGPSEAMDYLVVLAQQGGAQKRVVVNAATGDEAATEATARNPGWKCSYVGPATGIDASPRLADQEA